ncbi:hypothetical protein ACVWZM_002678 [Bradyrhizobium sp. USDA 4501]
MAIATTRDVHHVLRPCEIAKMLDQSIDGRRAACRNGFDRFDHALFTSARWEA